jgi:hypothetical protein
LFLSETLPFEPDADNTDEGRNKMIDKTKEKTSAEVVLPASRKIYVETNGNTVNQNREREKGRKGEGENFLIFPD